MVDNDKSDESKMDFSAIDADRRKTHSKQEWINSSGDSKTAPQSHNSADGNSTFTSTTNSSKNLSLPKLDSDIKDIINLLENGEIDNASESADSIIHRVDILRKNGMLSRDVCNQLVSKLDALKSSDGYEEFSTITKSELIEQLNSLRTHLGVSKEKVSDHGRANEYIEKLKQREKTMQQQQNELQKIENRLKEKEHKLTNTFDEITNRREEIEEAQTEAENLEAIRSQLVQWEAGEAIGGQFKQRKKELRKSLRGWLFGSLISIAILLGFSFMLYKDISSASSQGTAVLSKITLLLPVSIAVWFFVTNYSQQKQLMREYEFKESMAISFRGFLEMLREDMSEEERPQIGEFTTNTMDRIYSNPQQNLSQSEESGDQNQNQGRTGPLSQGAVAQILNRLGKK